MKQIIVLLLGAGVLYLALSGKAKPLLNSVLGAK